MARKIATADRVDLDALLDFVRPRHRFVLATRKSDGSPQISPVTGGVDDAGRLVVSTYPERAKARNVRSAGVATVLVLSDEWDGPWVQVDGACEVIEAAGDTDVFVEYYRNIAGEHPDWDEYRSAMVEQGKAVIRLTPTSWGPIATGGFPARLA